MLSMLADNFTKPLMLENEKIMEKQKKNQDAAPMKTRTLKTRARSQNNGKQDQTEKWTKNNKGERKIGFAKSINLVIIF